MKCPNCGGEMETGFLTIPLHFGLHSMKWNSEPRHSVLGDDIVYDPKQHDLGRLDWSAIPAERCTACRTVVFSYAQADYPDEGHPTSDMLVRRA